METPNSQKIDESLMIIVHHLFISIYKNCPIHCISSCFYFFLDLSISLSKWFKKCAINGSYPAKERELRVITISWKIVCKFHTHARRATKIRITEILGERVKNRRWWWWSWFMSTAIYILWLGMMLLCWLGIVCLCEAHNKSQQQ